MRRLTRQDFQTISPRHALLRDDPIARLVRLFRDHEAADATGLEIPSGLIVEGYSRYRLDLVRDLQILSDWPSEHGYAVLPPGETTAILFRAAEPPSRVKRILDLGCGSGTLALLLAGRADEVVATDVNPRALDLSQRNADLNNITNIEFRAGSLWEPLHGDRFDLIVSQPPFLPPPVGAPSQIFLHGTDRGDELAREIAAGLAEHLNPHGRAFLFSDWPLTLSESLPQRIHHAGLLARVFASPPILPESYTQAYGVSFRPELNIRSVRQCLAILQAGQGWEEIPILPHQWMNFDMGQSPNAR